MENGLEAEGSAELRGVMQVVDERLESGGRQPRLGVIVDPTGELLAVGLVEMVGEDGERSSAVRRPIDDEAELIAQPRPVVVGLLGSAEMLVQE